MTKAAQKKAVQFTRMCKFWRTNECKMGADCTFAHASSELRPSPKPCFEFSKTGSCTRGQACRFVHSTEGSKGSGNAKEKDAAVPEASSFQGPLLGAFARQTAFGPVSMGTPMPELGHMVPRFMQTDFPLPCIRPPPGLEDMGPMAGLASHGLRSFNHTKTADGDSRRSSLSETSLGLERISLPIPKAADLEQMWAADDATVATQSLTSTMCLSATPSSFSGSDGPEGTSFWL